MVSSSDPSHGRSLSAAAYPILVVAITVAVFLAVTANGFVNLDDPTRILQNPNYRGFGWTQLKAIWTAPFFNHYSPITDMTYCLDYVIWGLDPAGFHLTAMLFHAANAALFYFLALGLLRIALREVVDESALRLSAAFAALFFAIHPLRVEAVAWAADRVDPVSGFFSLLTLLVYVKGFRRDVPQKYRWATFAFLILAVLSKETAVTLPAVLVILDIYPLRRWGRTALLEKIPLFAVSLVSSVLIWWAAAAHSLDTSLSAYTGLIPRITISIYSLAHYLWKTIVPVRLSPGYALEPGKVDPAGLPFLISLVACIAITATAILFRKRMPYLLAAWAAYIVMLSPLLGFVAPTIQVTPDRYAYLPSLPIALLAGAALFHLLPKWSPAPAAVAAVLLAALGVLSWLQVRVWKDAETLWTHSVATEGSFFSYTMLATVREEKGDSMDAMEYYRKAIELRPDYALAHNNLGAILMNRGESAAASREFETAIRLKPDLPTAYFGLGVIHMTQDHYSAAIAQFRRALEVNPKYEAARQALRRAEELRTVLGQ